MIESRYWKKWLHRLSSGLVGATGAWAAPQAELLRESGAQRLPTTGCPVHLQGDELIRVRHAAGAEVRALRGNIWVTQDGDPRDVVLGAGESFRFDRNRPALVAPFGSADVVLTTGPLG